jgi:cellulose synthase/poly-beta-1,6-N-acetylglucosamine synthase-like glycosyltransferase
VAPPTATVVVPTRDRPAQLAACLAALDAQTAPQVEVVVVDDASRDPAAVAAVTGSHPEVRLARAAGAGPAAARNLGAGLAGGDVVCFTDDDCRPGPDWVAHLLGCVERGAPAAAGPTFNGRPRDVYAAASQTVTNHLADSYRSSGGPVFAPTSNLAVRIDVFRALPFDETFPLAAGEDRDWCQRLAAAGHELAFEPAAWVSHHQDLGWRGFWRQQVRYGRGARHLRARSAAPAMQPASFYLDLVRRGFAHGARTGGLLLVAQVATVVGLARETAAQR